MRILILIAALVVAATARAEDDLWADGTDVTMCGASDGAPILVEGYYSLDYFVTLGFGYGDPVPATSSAASLDRIERLLDDKVGQFGDSLRTFRRYYQDGHPQNPQFWMQSTLGTRDLENPDIIDLFPPSCTVRGGISAIKMIERRDMSDGRILFLYQWGVAQRMERDTPLQLSYLLIHEWLHFISGHPARNRIINRFLHSSAIDAMTPEQVQAELHGMGLEF